MPRDTVNRPSGNAAAAAALHQWLTPVPNPKDDDRLQSVSDPILLFLTVDIVALLLLGACGDVLPHKVGGLLTAALSGLGLLLCLPPLLSSAPATAAGLPVGPPGLSLHLALDGLSACFLVVVFLAGTAVATFQATIIPLTPMISTRTTAFCLAGAILVLLAADGVALAIGLAIVCGVIWLPAAGGRIHAVLLIPLLPLAAICLLTPSGLAPRFDAIRAASADPGHLTAAAGLMITAVAGLGWAPSVERGWPRPALVASVVIPISIYLLLRLLVDLSGPDPLPGPGFILLLGGGVLAVIEGWRAAGHPRIDGSAACLARRQTGVAMAAIGLALIGRAADLPEAASLALAACLLTALGSGLAGGLVLLAVAGIGSSAGTYRLSSLGGLIHTMPATSFALAAGLLGLSALPPGLGFVSLWLLFQSILSAPRTGGLLFQLPLALTGGAIALSAAATTAASVRLIGVALLGRPRTPLGAAAQEGKAASRTVLLVISGLSLVTGALPGLVLWVFADTPIHFLTDVVPDPSGRSALLAASAASPGYLAIPVLALLALATGAAMLAPRWSRRERKTVGLWVDGREPPAGLPFGEPAAQSDGEGFLPAVPALPRPRLPAIPTFAALRPPSAAAGLSLLVAACGALLLALAVIR